MKKVNMLLSLLFLVNLSISAQDTVTETVKQNPIPGIMTDPMNYLILFVIVILLSTVLVMARTIKVLLWQVSGKPETKRSQSQVPVKAGSSMMSRLKQRLSGAKPVENEADLLLDHEYDGIKELDNNLPSWWKYGFYLTIVFALIYMAHYHVTGKGDLQLEEYNTQLADAEKMKTERLKEAAVNVDETNVTVLNTDADITEGKKLFDEKCMVCHGKSGEGLVGPNLTDDYWIHGGKINDIFKIIKYGFPSKGMLAWQGQMTPVQMQQVASYIKSIHGTNPPNAKEPQGEPFQETAPTAMSDSIVADASTPVPSISN